MGENIVAILHIYEDRATFYFFVITKTPKHSYVKYNLEYINQYLPIKTP